MQTVHLADWLRQSARYCGFNKYTMYPELLMPAVTQVLFADFPSAIPCRFIFQFSKHFSFPVGHTKLPFLDLHIRFNSMACTLNSWHLRSGGDGERLFFALLLRSPPKWGSAPSRRALTSPCETVSTELKGSLPAGSGPSWPCPLPPTPTLPLGSDLPTGHMCPGQTLSAWPPPGR